MAHIEETGVRLGNVRAVEGIAVPLSKKIPPHEQEAKRSGRDVTTLRQGEDWPYWDLYRTEPQLIGPGLDGPDE
ncbi:hypothetical protein AX14_009372 [Amanita brunnescens Koide BX004]|nr:hypothetical protein AX14_009372 [Amanita brunnescens Koide BX004]